MSFSLPKFSLDVVEVTLTSGDVDLVERNIDGNWFDLPLSLPYSLHSCVAVLTYSVRAGIPETNFPEKLKASSIVRQRKTNVIERGHVGTMYCSVEIVAYSGNYGRLMMIAMEDLVWTINEIVSVIKILFFLQMVLNLTDVDLRCKRVRVHDR